MGPGLASAGGKVRLPVSTAPPPPLAAATILKPHGLGPHCKLGAQAACARRGLQWPPPGLLRLPSEIGTEWTARARRTVDRQQIGSWRWRRSALLVTNFRARFQPHFQRRPSVAPAALAALNPATNTLKSTIACGSSLGISFRSADSQVGIAMRIRCKPYSTSRPCAWPGSSAAKGRAFCPVRAAASVLALFSAADGAEVGSTTNKHASSKHRHARKRVHAECRELEGSTAIPFTRWSGPLRTVRHTAAAAGAR